MSEDIINVKLTVDKMAVKSETLNLLVLIYFQQSGAPNRNSGNKNLRYSILDTLSCEIFRWHGFFGP